MKKESNVPTYTKQQLIEAKRYTPQQRDVLNALLDDKESYTHEQIAIIVDEFHRKVCE